MGPKFAGIFYPLFAYANHKIDQIFGFLERKYVDMYGSKFVKTLEKDLFHSGFVRKL